MSSPEPSLLADIGAVELSSTLSLPFGLGLNNILAIVAAVLLVFVSGGVIYLSSVEWRDRRRRQQPVSASPRGRR